MGVITRGRPKKLASGYKPPKVWAVYRFRNMVTGDLDYIGITSNLYERFANHKSTGKFDVRIHELEYKEAKIGVTWDEMREWEIAKIKKHNPHLNIARGGNGRRASIEINGELYDLSEDKSIGDILSDHDVPYTVDIEET